MAQLKAGSTVGGNTILTTASSVGFPSGTVMVFHQASAPTGWTKSTTHNDKTLRVVSGSGGGSGGTHGLSSPPSTSHTHTGGSHTHSVPSHNHNHNLSAGSHTLSTSQMPSHSHTIDTYQPGWNNPGGHGYISVNYQNDSFYRREASMSTESTGSSSGHSHSLSGSVSSSSAANTGSGSGTTGSGGPTAFSPQYIDVIVCSKD